MAPPFVCIDDDVVVDRVITAKKTVGEKLPSYGRDLVPYFVPGAPEMDARNINVNTDVDALRRSGGNVLSIPAPAVSDKRQKRVHKKKASKSPPKQAQYSREPAPLRSTTPVVKAAGQGHRDFGAPASAPLQVLKAEPWAGPAYVNSPPPSSLPVPGFLLAGKANSSGFAQAESASPLRTGRLFEESSTGGEANYVDRAAIEFSLKRILQVV